MGVFLGVSLKRRKCNILIIFQYLRLFDSLLSYRMTEKGTKP